ncbi:hypothetical protein D3C87_1765630 [compost metagenome]
MRRQAAAPHRVIGTDDQQLGGMTREHCLHLRPDKSQQRQHVHATHALASGRSDSDFGFPQSRATAAKVAGEHPARGPVKQSGDVIDAKGVLADPRPGGFDAFPAAGQLEFKA